MKKRWFGIFYDLALGLLLFLRAGNVYAADADSFITRTIKHKILKSPKILFANLFGFVKSNIVYFGWGLVIIGSLFGIILFILYLTKKPKAEPVPYIQTNQPRNQTPPPEHLEQFAGTILYDTQASGYQENIPMIYELMIIGRNPGCQIVLQDYKVSDQHAQIYTQEGRYFVRDLGSPSGTFVNGVLITDIVELFQGYYVQMGDSTIQL